MNLLLKQVQLKNRLHLDFPPFSLLLVAYFGHLIHTSNRKGSEEVRGLEKCALKLNRGVACSLTALAWEEMCYPITQILWIALKSFQTINRHDNINCFMLWIFRVIDPLSGSMFRVLCVCLTLRVHTFVRSGWSGIHFTLIGWKS